LFRKIVYCFDGELFEQSDGDLVQPQSNNFTEDVIKTVGCNEARHLCNNTEDRKNL